MAPRPPARLWRRLARGAFHPLCLWLAVLAPMAAQATSPKPCALYGDPTEEYRHCVLGDCVEYRSLIVYDILETAEDDIARNPAIPAAPVYERHEFTLPPGRVFEDTYPRCLNPRVPGQEQLFLVVESDAKLGARLVLFAIEGGTLVRRAATPFIGRANRWLAPVGAIDLDRDGVLEFAYVDRPHLLRTLRVVRQDGDRLVEVAASPGHTNHRIGEDFITGGIRGCWVHPEIVTVSQDWTRILVSTFDGTRLKTRDIGPFSRAAMKRAMVCK